MKINTVCYTPSVQRDRTTEQLAIACFHIALPSLLFYTMIHKQLGYAIVSVGESLKLMHSADAEPPPMPVSAIQSVSEPECIFE